MTHPSDIFRKTVFLGKLFLGNLKQVNIYPVVHHIIQRNMLTSTLPKSEQFFATPTRLVSLDHTCNDAWLTQMECDNMQ